MLIVFLCHLLKYYVLCDDFSWQALEPVVHGRGRNADLQDMYFGVHEELLYARKIKPVEGIVELCLLSRRAVIRCLVYDS